MSDTGNAANDAGHDARYNPAGDNGKEWRGPFGMNLADLIVLLLSSALIIYVAATMILDGFASKPASPRPAAAQHASTSPSAAAKAVESRVSGDVAALREVMKTGVDPRTLTNRFQIVQSVHSDSPPNPPQEIGGDATSVMNWFFADDGRVFRVHYDGRVVELDKAPNWVLGMRPANKPSDRAR